MESEMEEIHITIDVFKDPRAKLKYTVLLKGDDLISEERTYLIKKEEILSYLRKIFKEYEVDI